MKEDGGGGGGGGGRDEEMILSWSSLVAMLLYFLHRTLLMGRKSLGTVRDLCSPQLGTEGGWGYR